MTPIVKCLEEGVWPTDENEARTLRMKINQYTMVDRVLFKKSYMSPMLRCMGPLQANYIIREVHEGACGMHVRARSLVAKIMRQGYYWPSMHQDTKEVWGLDILGPLPKGPGKLKFGLPRVIVTDNETQLVNDPFKSWCEKWKIKQMNIAVAHPQANGLVERANKSLMHGLKARLGQERWNEEDIRLNLDLTQERREMAAVREAKYKKKVEQYYNKRVWPISFKVGDFVYQRNEAIRVEN
ncbi:reverse transcriptase domain-containing protein [Tanacetum coccineum]